MIEVKKIDIATDIFAAVHLEGVEKPRREFIKRFNAAHLEVFGEEAKSNIAPSYYQMLKYEADENGGRYKHHNKAKKVEAVEEPTAPIEIVEVAAPTGNWAAVKGDVVAYFASRDAAREYNRANGGGFKIEKVA